MKAKTVTDNVNARIDELLSERARTLQKYQDIIDQATKRKESATEDMQSAIEAEDPKRYKTAKDRIAEAESLIALYTAKIDLVKKQELVSNADTLQIRRSIKGYEVDLSEKFTAQIDKLIDQIEELYNSYDHEIKEAEKALVRWCNDIGHFDHSPYYGSPHANKIGTDLKKYRNWEQFTPCGKVG